MRYYRLCKTLTDYGTFIPENIDIQTQITDRNIDWYKSIYTYSEEQKIQAEETIFDEVKNKHRPRGISGIEDVVTNRLVFDFDSNESLSLSKDDALMACSRLIERGIPTEAIQLHFSGNKGYSVEVETDTILTPPEFKNITIAIAGDLKTYDKVVTNPGRIFRIGYTRHQKSGLYKIPLSFQELSDASPTMVREWAVSIPDKPEYPETWGQIRLPIAIKILKTPKVEVKKENTSDIHLDLNWSLKPKWLSKQKFALQMGYFPEGSRSYAMEILAATYKAQGFPKDLAFKMLQGVSERQAKIHNCEKYPDRDILATNIATVYNNSWRGGTYNEESFPPDLKRYLIDFGITNDTKKVNEDLVAICDTLDLFSDYAKNIEQNTVRFNLDEIDSRLRVQRGQLIGLLAGPGIGKTSFLLTVLNNTSKEGLNSLFFSFDMSRFMITQKLIQRESGHYSNTIFKAYQDSNKRQIDEYRKLLAENYGNVTFSFKSGMTIDGMKQAIIEREEITGKEITLVGVDYLELVQSDFNEPTQASAHAIQGLREIANDLNKAVIVLLQPNKISSKPNKPLLDYNCAKGSSAIAQAVTAMITAHRPGYSSEHPEEDVYFSCNVVKSRMGALFSADFGWDGLTGKISTLDDAEKMQLHELREQQKAMEKIDKSSNF